MVYDVDSKRLLERTQGLQGAQKTDQTRGQKQNSATEFAWAIRTAIYSKKYILSIKPERTAHYKSANSLIH